MDSLLLNIRELHQETLKANKEISRMPDMKKTMLNCDDSISKSKLREMNYAVELASKVYDVFGDVLSELTAKLEEGITNIERLLETSGRHTPEINEYDHRVELLQIDCKEYEKKGT